jgi:hypothetical protein
VAPFGEITLTDRWAIYPEVVSEPEHGPEFARALVDVFGPGLTNLGFRLAELLDDGVRFDGDRVRFEARYIPRDGDLAVYIIPHDTGERLSLLLYLRAVWSDAWIRLGDAVAESSDQAVNIGRTYADALPNAAKLLTGDQTELARARGLRWWDVQHDQQAASSGDISGH